MFKGKRFTPAMIVAMIALAVALSGTAVAGTAKLITGSQIANGTIKLADINSSAKAALKGKTGAPGPQGPVGAQGAVGPQGATGAAGAQGPKGDIGTAGAQGPKGDKGDSGLTGAFYATAFYNAGNTNEGAIATVACDADPAKTDYVAISGGVQVLGLDAGANSRNTPVSSSFPGRMDWNTNAPKPDRLDGWIVQFGGNAGVTSDKAPEKVKVWALCVPGASTR
ncbi:MAG TPA: hypothetical protein VIZ31_02010 [Vicinamibacteria bacterium]